MIGFIGYFGYNGVTGFRGYRFLSFHDFLTPGNVDTGRETVYIGGSAHHHTADVKDRCVGVRIGLGSYNANAGLRFLIGPFHAYGSVVEKSGACVIVVCHLGAEEIQALQRRLLAGETERGIERCGAHVGGPVMLLQRHHG